jgi:hypothetical protein
LLKWTTPKLTEIFKPPLIEQHASEVALPASSLSWSTATIIEAGAEHLLDLMFERKPFGSSLIIARTLPTRAFASLAALRRPDLVPESATPVEAAITMALWAQANAGVRMLFGTPASIVIDHSQRSRKA